MIPLLSLTALWIFGTSVTTRDSLNLLAVSSLYEEIGNPGDQLTIALQREHLLSAEYLGAPSERTQTELLRQRQQVDLLRQRMRRLALTETAQSRLATPEMRARFADVMAVVDKLDATRASVDSGAMDLVTLTRDYAMVPDAMQKLVVSMSLTGGLELFHQSQSLTAMAYAKDHLSRERALAAGAMIENRPLNPGELRTFSALATTRRFLFDQGMAELEPSVRAPFAALARSEEYRRFSTLENDIVLGEGRTFSHKTWRTITDRVEGSYQGTLTRAGAALAAGAEPVAMASFVRAGLAGALGLIAVVSSLLVAFRVGRRLTRELGDLRTAAADLATVRLPRVVERLRAGEEVDTAVEVPPLVSTATTTEVRELTAAFSSVQCTAVRAAVEQTRLRDAVGEAFRNLARRSQSLLQRQLRLLDGMQRHAEDPETLRDLFRVDHLTTRMRRHAEGLVILSGASPGRTFRQEVPVMDALRAAVGEVEDYTRVRVHPMPEVMIVGNAVADVIHLCAEMIENATSFSPPNTEVTVNGEMVARGFAVEIEDRGLGMTAGERDALNEKLARPAEFDPADTKRLGMFVIGRLAARHDIRVELRASPYGGTTAIILLPDRLITMPERPAATPVRPTPPPARTAILPAARARSFFDERPASPPSGLPVRTRTAPATEASRPQEAADPSAPLTHDAPEPPAPLTQGAPEPTGPRSLDPGPRLPREETSGPMARPWQHAPERADAARSPDAPAPQPPPASRPAAPGKGALPRRTRQASLAPQLRPQKGHSGPAVPAAHGGHPREDQRGNGHPREEQRGNGHPREEQRGDGHAWDEQRGNGHAREAERGDGHARDEHGGSAAVAGTPVERSPEESRALFDSLQLGWRRGRAGDRPDGEEV
ncbi:nitrate- and nitrite sensing domain-containing protein [Sphaerisporangium rhizosphaerae]|uniref:histidine kinase n=1 Tax=Sphaerisporangium rhizosphaerae TaxID=2269375 RepID=A0ABW2NXH4_9ACTN